MNTIFSGFIGQGEKVEEFDKEFSLKFRIKNVVSLNSGTSALKLALALAGVGPGDEVISTPYTMVATNTAILEQFARPVFADIDRRTFNIDPESLARAITEKTKAVIPVHLYGQIAEMDEISAVAEKHSLAVIEDAAQAIGAAYKGKKAGSFGTTACFSFFPSKNLGAYGDAGFVVTDVPWTSRMQPIKPRAATAAAIPSATTRPVLWRGARSHGRDCALFAAITSLSRCGSRYGAGVSRITGMRRDPVRVS